MKKTLKFLSAGIMLSGLVFFQSCDKCKDVECQNGGTCTDGVCSCLDGFSGTNCETEDKCITQNPNCKNGGTCDDGVCTCTTGYEGTDCGTKMVTKFIGTWNDVGTDDCSISTYSVGITESTTVAKILISNFGKYGCAGSWPTIEATVNGTQITIASQTFCPTDQFTVSGTGSINSAGNAITLAYSGTKPPSDGGGTYSCNVTFSK